MLSGQVIALRQYYVVVLFFCSAGQPAALALPRFVTRILKPVIADGLRNLNLYFMLPSLLLSFVSLRQSSTAHLPVCANCILLQMVPATHSCTATPRCPVGFRFHFARCRRRVLRTTVLEVSSKSARRDTQKSELLGFFHF